MPEAGSTVYSISVDTEDAEQSLDNLSQQMEDLDAAADTVELGAKRASQAIRMGAESCGAAASELGAAAREAGAQFDGMGADVDGSFRRMGASQESFGDAFRAASQAALKENESLSRSIRAGLTGAFSYTEVKFKGFASRFQKGAKNIGASFRHPVQAIRDKLVKALSKAEKSEEDVGDEADKTKGALHELGAAGAGAGGKIKDAFKEGLKAMIGVEAIKKGIELVKQFVGSLLEAGGAAENVGAKFKDVFGSEASGAEEWARNFAGAVHRSKTEVKEFMASSQSMFASMGMEKEAAADLSKLTTSFTYDFGAHFKMDDTEALGVVQDIMKGNAEVAAEYGLKMDDATLKASALAMGLGGQIDELDDAAMAQVRMNALLEQTGNLQKAAIEDTGGMVNSTKSLKGIWNDFTSAAGAKFTPLLEKLTGVIMEAWPTLEPMLLQFVDILSSGMAQAAPVLLDLGQTLIPVLTSVLGTLFEAAAPLLSVFGELAQTILPPVAQVVGLIAETVMPPLVGILSTLNTAIIQPLMPVIQSLAESLLPPIAALLGAVSPILEAISPVLQVIGKVLEVIGDVLGTIVGWLADGIGAIANFFGGLFGGAQESKSEVSELGKELDSLDGANATVTVSQVSTGGAEAAGAPASDMPHNARGTDNFAGGWTHINEEGGEAAFLPKGTTILPANETQKLVQNRSSRSEKKTKLDLNFNITVQGNPDALLSDEILGKLKKILIEPAKEAIREALEEDYSELAIQDAVI